jgi:hypothetical protein
VLKGTLFKDEILHVKLRGIYKEALVCTNQRVMVVKGGYMVGQTFGTNLFQVPYQSVSGVEVKFNIMYGYFELSAGGMQNTPKKVLAANSSNTPQQALNCVSLNSRKQAQRFREACGFIISHQASLNNRNSQNIAKSLSGNIMWDCIAFAT